MLARISFPRDKKSNIQAILIYFQSDTKTITVSLSVKCRVSDDGLLTPPVVSDDDLSHIEGHVLEVNS